MTQIWTDKPVTIATLPDIARHIHVIVGADEYVRLTGLKLARA